MLTIDHLSLHLPAGLEARAEPIARQVAEALSHLPFTHSRRLEGLAVPRTGIAPGSSDAQIARSIATAIHTALEGGDRGCST